MTNSYTIELDGKALHHYGKGVYGWGKYSSTDEKIGTLVEWSMESEAEEWMKKRRVFCTGAIIKAQAKRGPGRPKTGTAMTPAEKQKAYRERLKKKEFEMAGKAIAGEKTYEQMMEANQKLIKAEAEILILKKTVEAERTRANKFMDENKGLRKQVELAEQERNLAFAQSKRILESNKKRDKSNVTIK